MAETKLNPNYLVVVDGWRGALRQALDSPAGALRPLPVHPAIPRHVMAGSARLTMRGEGNYYTPAAPRQPFLPAPNSVLGLTLRRLQASN